MVNKAAFFIFLLWFSWLGNAQTASFSVEKSALFKDEYKQSVFVLAEKETSGDLIFARYYESDGLTPGDGLYIEKYGSDLKLKKEFDFKTDHPNSEKYNMIVGVFSASNIIHIIEIYYDLDQKAVVCRSNNIDANFKASRKELFSLSVKELQDLGSFSMQQIFFDRSKEMWSNNLSGEIKSETDLSRPESTFPRIPFNISMVVNDSKTAFAVALDIKQTKSKMLKMYLFDSNLKLKFDADLTREQKDEKYIFQNIQVASDGNSLYFLGKSYDESLRKKETGGKYFFELMQVTASDQKILKIEPESHFIGYLKPIIRGQEIYCLGFFSDLNDSNYTGICYFKTNTGLNSVEKTKFNPFSRRLISDKYGALKEGKKYKALTNLVFRNVFFTENQDLYLSAEEEEITTSSSGVGVGVGSKTKLTYDYDDIISAKLNADGEVLWDRCINKNQHRSDEDNFYISYTSMVKNNALYFFINADEKVKTLNDGRIEFGQVSKDKSNLNILQIDTNGDFEHQEILNNQSSSIPFMVSKGIVVDNVVYFLGRKGKEKQLLKVTL